MAQPSLKILLEAALLAGDEPLSLERLGLLFDESQRPGRDTLRAALAALERDYAGRGVELVEVASGFRVQVRQELSPWVSRLWEERAARYSRALLETLALIAYRQPITRGEIEEVRGVSVSTSIVKTLLERGWIKVLGHREVPGRPALYGTTRGFLDYFNLKSLSELPPLAELRDLDAIGAELERRQAAESASGAQPDLFDAPPTPADTGQETETNA
jgi:segregation and condensation protein B